VDRVSVKPKKRLQLLIRLTKDHVEGQQVSVLQVAVSRQGVDGERLESVVEEQAVLAGGIDDPCPARRDEVLLSLDCGSLLPLWVGQPAGRRVFQDDISF
jgi:hypothetical protein